MSDQPLSPAAQAIFAFYETNSFEYDTKDLTAIASVLRAAAEYLSMYSPYTGCDEDEGVVWACNQLLTITAQLEAM
jgi:hypothetical protein